MSFMYKLRMLLAKVTAGRNGLDNLAYATLWGGLICSLLGSVLGVGLLSLAGMALYVYTVVRMMSRNISKRAEENRRWVQFQNTWQTKLSQFLMRLKNSKQYKYFHCPKCRVIIRLTRGCGEKTVRCPKCGHEFQQKA